MIDADPAPKVDLGVDLGGLRLRNPVVTASGCFASGREMARFFALSTLGAVWCTVPAMVGGNPKFGYELMQRSMALTKRGSHGTLVMAAERCAVALQDRKLYYDLLMEVIQAGDVPEYRLPNKLARKRAERLLKQIDEFFYD